MISFGYMSLKLCCESKANIFYSQQSFEEVINVLLNIHQHLKLHQFTKTLDLILVLEFQIHLVIFNLFHNFLYSTFIFSDVYY